MENLEFTSNEQPKLDQDHTRKRFHDRLAVVTGGGSGKFLLTNVDEKFQYILTFYYILTQGMNSQYRCKNRYN